MSVVMAILTFPTTIHSTLLPYVCCYGCLWLSVASLALCVLTVTTVAGVKARVKVQHEWPAAAAAVCLRCGEAQV